jgi:hypothetical protein
MRQENDLYTDYALQIFSSYLIEDISSMKTVLESFRSEGKDEDHFFLPGLIYGLLYHLATILKLVSDASDVTVEKLLSDYAMDYAIVREELLQNPLLNVRTAKEMIDKLAEELKTIEDLFKDSPDD